MSLLYTKRNIFRTCAHHLCFKLDFFFHELLKCHQLNVECRFLFDASIFKVLILLPYNQGLNRNKTMKQDQSALKMLPNQVK